MHVKIPAAFLRQLFLKGVSGEVNLLVQVGFGISVAKCPFHEKTPSRTAETAKKHNS